ncbi:MAG: flippase-like domain-containing protein, partial [Anaerolineae bacterium]|nr:flippase-like domain-containing protein [Anaerolineae bacterium]
MRDKATTFLKVFISLILIVIVFSRVDLAAVAAQLATARPALVAAALLFYLLAIAVNAVKWLVLLRAQGVRVPFGELLQMQFVGFFFNNFLPANVGGDVMRGYTLARYTDRL